MRQNKSVVACFNMCSALGKTKGEWDNEFFIPMLSDKRPDERWTHPVIPGMEEPRLAIRVCDQAALVISRHRKDIQFQMVGKREEMDRQIRRIQNQRMGERNRK